MATWLSEKNRSGLSKRPYILCSPSAALFQATSATPGIHTRGSVVLALIFSAEHIVVIVVWLSEKNRSWHNSYRTFKEAIHLPLDPFLSSLSAALYQTISVWSGIHTKENVNLALISSREFLNSYISSRGITFMAVCLSEMRRSIPQS